MSDEQLRAAADRIAELEPAKPDNRPKAKLPKARSYLKAATWGFDEMVKNRHVGVAFIRHLVAIASVARAVPAVLIKTDREISDAHKAVIGAWFAHTQPATTPVIRFLKTFRDVALHDGTLSSYAVRSDLRHGEGRNAIIISRDYDVAHYDENGDWHDLLAKLRQAFDWLETELAQIVPSVVSAGRRCIVA